jgi:hypothetical protein
MMGMMPILAMIILDVLIVIVEAQLHEGNIVRLMG